MGMKKLFCGNVFETDYIVVFDFLELRDGGES